MARDFVQEMRTLVDAETFAGENISTMAVRIVEKLRKSDPELLAGWLDAQAVQLLREAINAIDRSARASARTQVSRRAFDRAATEDRDVTSYLDVRYVIDDADTRMPLGEMHAEQLIFVASGYEKTAASARFEAAFFRALARRVGSRSVEDVFTSEAIMKLRAAIDGFA